MSERPSPTLPAVMVGAEDAAAMLGVSRNTFDAWAKDGTLGPKPVPIGGTRRNLYRVAELTSWADHGCPGRVAWLRRLDCGDPIRLKRA